MSCDASCIFILIRTKCWHVQPSKACRLKRARFWIGWTLRQRKSHALETCPSELWWKRRRFFLP